MYKIFRLAVFKNIQSGSPNPTPIRPLCPTRWTCRTLSSILLSNYSELMLFLDWVKANGDKKSEGFKQAPGGSSLFIKSDFT